MDCRIGINGRRIKINRDTLPNTFRQFEVRRLNSKISFENYYNAAKIFLIISISIFVVRFVLGIGPYERESRVRTYYTLEQFRFLLTAQRDYFREQIKNNNFPRLGVYMPFSEETIYFEKILQEKNESRFQRYLEIKDSPKNIMELKPEEKVSYVAYPVYPTIVSLDYETGNLFAGFIEVPFLGKEFYENFNKQDHFRRRIQDRTLSLLRYGEYSDGYGLVQNAKGEPFNEGKTVMRFVGTISSEDVKLHYQ